ncbi:MAG: DUF3237 family protein [Geodermatophilaceae bacterium]
MGQPSVTARQQGKMAHDWLMLNADGSVSVDGRLLLMTDDGAPITSTYRGKAAKPPAEGGVVLTTPVFETGNARQLWLNSVQCRGEGRSRVPHPDLRAVPARLTGRSDRFRQSVDKGPP